MKINVKLFTKQHLIQGLVNTKKVRLTDFLNTPNESSFLVEDVKILRLSALNDAPVEIPIIKLNRWTIVFAVPDGKTDLNVSSFNRRVSRMPQDVFVCLESCEVSGRLHLARALDIDNVFVTMPNDFVPLTQATVTFPAFSCTVKARTVIINKHRITFVGLPGEEAEPAAIEAVETPSAESVQVQ